MTRPDGTNGTAGLTFDQFFYGVAQQESGGNYGAINPNSGALGKYQIMPSNVPNWSQKYLGVRWTTQQFLGDPYKQEALAKAVLSDYYTKFGARGAAAAWYSGRAYLANDYTKQNNGPPVGEYVDKVIAKSMRLPYGASVYGSPMPVNTAPNIKPTVVDKTVKPAPPAANTPDSAGMAAVTAPGSSAVGGLGAQAVDSWGAEAAGGVPQDLPYMNQTEQSPVAGAPSPASSGREMAINAALKWLGTPYVFGGGSASGPTRSPLAHGNFQSVGFDCSGLVQYALAAAGISTSHYSYTQLLMGPKTAVKALEPGDLVGFGDGHHIALYLGNNQIVEAPYTGATVRVRSLGKGEDAWGVSLSGQFK